MQKRDNLSLSLLSLRWNHVVEQIPRWVAPNLITVVGLAVNVATSVLLMAQCPTATEQVREMFLCVMLCP